MYLLQAWSDALADVAAVNACQCNFQPANLPPIPYRNHYARENHIYYPANNLGSMVAYWYLEHENYNCYSGQCDGDATCEHYLNVSSYIRCMGLWKLHYASCIFMCAIFKNFAILFFIVDRLGLSM